MIILRILGAIIGLAASFIILVLAYNFLGWGWSDGGGHWNLLQWGLGAVPWVILFSFSFWLVYRCFKAKQMSQVKFLEWSVCPRALVRASIAEICVVLAFILKCWHTAYVHTAPG